MKLIIALGCLALSALIPAASYAAEPAAQSDDAVKATLTSLEHQSWDAWKARNGKFYETFLSEDHLDVQPGGPIGKKDVVAGVGSPACVVASFNLGPMTFTRISPDTAALVYHAEQDTKCGGHAIPPASWITSIYVNRDGRWQNFLFNDVTASK